MNFDPLSFVIGNHGDSGPVRDVVSYLIGRIAGTVSRIWQTLTDVAVASFTAVSATLRELVIDVTPIQEAGTPSPETPLPISGWTGANVYVYGANVADDLQYTDGYFIAADGTITANSQFQYADYISASSHMALHFKVRMKDNPGTYYIRVHEYNAEKVWLRQKAAILLQRNGTVEADVAISADAAYVQFSLPNTTRQSLYELNIGKVFSVSWQAEAGTVYGGTLTDNGDGTWTLAARPYYAEYNGETLAGPWVSSMEVYVPETTPTTGAQVVDLGGTETIYILTADSVRVLIGQNNIFADTGNINTITFRTH